MLKNLDDLMFEYSAQSLDSLIVNAKSRANSIKHLISELKIATITLESDDMEFFKGTPILVEPWSIPSAEDLCSFALAKKIPMSYLLLRINWVRYHVQEHLNNRGFDFPLPLIDSSAMRFRLLRIYGLLNVNDRPEDKEPDKPRLEKKTILDGIRPIKTSISAYSERELFGLIQSECRKNNIPLSLVPKLMILIMTYIKTGRFRPILLVGDPGIGKTYLATVLSGILGIPFYKISAQCAATGRGLVGDGGTYKCSGPGEIVQAMKVTKCANPIILIDEIDKSTSRRDAVHNIADELLSALDGSRMVHDLHLEKDISTAEMVFILTANELQPIPAWLKDRCDIISFPAPDKDRLHAILSSYLDEKLSEEPYNDRILISEDILDALIESMVSARQTSIRQYIATLDTAIDSAYYKLLHDHLEQTDISVTDLGLVTESRRANGHRHIGFL